MKEERYDLDERLLEYAAMIVRLVEETEELIRIFFSSIRTAKKKIVCEEESEPYPKRP